MKNERCRIVTAIVLAILLLVGIAIQSFAEGLTGEEGGLGTIPGLEAMSGGVGQTGAGAGAGDSAVYNGDLSALSSQVAQQVAASYPLDQWRQMAQGPIGSIFKQVYIAVEKAKAPFIKMLSSNPITKAFYSERDDAIKMNYIFGPGTYESAFGTPN